MKYGAIDIGTNAARLLIGEVEYINSMPHVKKVSYTRIPLRLGIEVFEEKEIGSKKRVEFIKTIHAFKLIAEIFEVKSLRAVATSAMREASNGSEIKEEIFQHTGVEIDIIDGDEEARLIMNSFLQVDPNESAKIVIDVGGGSTEISLFNKGERVSSKSFKIGTIRLLKEKVKSSSWEELDEWLGEQQKKFKGITVFATGGNINKVHKLLGHKHLEPIPFDEINDLYATLKSMTLEQRIEQFSLKEDRADVIIPALKIYLKIMRKLKTKEVIVPKVGLSDGVIIELSKD